MFMLFLIVTVAYYYYYTSAFESQTIIFATDIVIYFYNHTTINNQTFRRTGHRLEGNFPDSAVPFIDQDGLRIRVLYTGYSTRSDFCRSVSPPKTNRKSILFNWVRTIYQQLWPTTHIAKFYQIYNYDIKPGRVT